MYVRISLKEIYGERERREKWIYGKREDMADINALIVRFYGFTENAREQEMDMREMVDKVKAGKPLYGTSELTPYMQGVASRNSRYSGIWIHVMPWFNFVNHNQVRIHLSSYLYMEKESN